MKLALLFLTVVICAAAFAQERRHTRTGNFRDIVGFKSAVLGDARNITVLLPPSYMTGKARRYPVLYAMDNQNVFDEATSFIGKEWRLDETACAMWKAGTLKEFIAVGVDHGGGKRTEEYTPGPGAERYLKFVMEEVKPMLDRRFRTMSGPAGTSIMGSSMGGLIALWAPLRHPEAFGQGAGLSNAYQRGDELFALAEKQPKKPVRLYMDVGGAETSNAVYQAGLEAQQKRLVAFLTAAGYREREDFVARVIPGAQHNESAWAARLDSVLLFLYPKK